jgi:uncharacterized protein (DUF2141 family)
MWLTVLLVLLVSPVFAQETGELSVIVSGAGEETGVLRARLASTPAAYRGEAPAYREAAVNVTGTAETVTFQNVESGSYAVAVYLDRNVNGSLDTNLFGAPKEPIGFSQNPRIGMARPTFAETSFDFDGGKQRIEIQL